MESLMFLDKKETQKYANGSVQMNKMIQSSVQVQ
jgi:hypothetical protein